MEIPSNVRVITYFISIFKLKLYSLYKLFFFNIYFFELKQVKIKNCLRIENK